MFASQLLVIENNITDRLQIIDEIRKHQLKNSIDFAENETAALDCLRFYIEKENRPGVILINYSKNSSEFVKCIRCQERFQHTKIYYLMDMSSGVSLNRETLFEDKISGIILKPLNFKVKGSFVSSDAASLYLDLIHTQNS